MAIVLKILGGISIFMLICTIICGCWIRVNKQDDMQFHFVLSLATVITSLVTIILFMIKK